MASTQKPANERKLTHSYTYSKAASINGVHVGAVVRPEDATTMIAKVRQKAIDMLDELKAPIAFAMSAVGALKIQTS